MNELPVVVRQLNMFISLLIKILNTMHIRYYPRYNFLTTLLIYASLFLIITPIYSQKLPSEKAEEYLRSRGEVYFKFIAPPGEIQKIIRIISVDNVKNDTVFAYANAKEFSNFINFDIPYEILLPPSYQNKNNIKMSENISDMMAWDSYPTYMAYLDMMTSFSDSYPDLCSLHEIGTSVNGRKILFVKISDNVSEKEAEPEFMYSSSMHGDELTGFILNLRLIDYLLTNYNTDPFVKRLVDGAEIWINPLANPDGTYYGGNNTVSGATRYNANYIDLNRNYPDPADGLHPDGEAWQAETVVMMDFMKAHNFVFSANYHGGAEVMNYPWDNFYRRHPDDAWLQYVSHCYADTAKKYGGSDYFSDVSENGITNGYDWYAVAGGRQDYMNYYRHGREITIEVSEVKLPAASNLPSFWDYNYKSMLYYIEKCLHGIRGIVSDSATHEPIRAKLEILDHDADSSQIYSDITNGNYHRMIAPGTWDLLITAPGYKNKVVEDVTVASYLSQVTVNVEMTKGSNPEGTQPAFGDNLPVFSVDQHNVLRMLLPVSGDLLLSIININGKCVYISHEYKMAGTSEIKLPIENLASGIYLLRIYYNQKVYTIKMSNNSQM